MTQIKRQSVTIGAREVGDGHSVFVVFESV